MNGIASVPRVPMINYGDEVWVANVSIGTPPQGPFRVVMVLLIFLSFSLLFFTSFSFSVLFFVLIAFLHFLYFDVECC